MEEPNISIWRVLRLHAKRTCLQQEFAQFLAIWQEEGLRLSDILKAMANYCRSESTKMPDEKSSWENVAILLEAAATQAETPTKELP